jgi:Topoisomerase IA
MAKNLLIVESPAKAKTINKYLGKDFTVLASYGHVRDLIPKEGAVDPDNGFAMRYDLIDKNENTSTPSPRPPGALTISIWPPTRTARARPSAGISPRSCASASWSVTSRWSGWCSPRSPRAQSLKP